MNTTLTASTILAIGDTHTLYFLPVLLNKIPEVRDFILIHVGDAGEGFHHKDRDAAELSELDEYLSHVNGKVLICRGNHSDPSFYKPNHWTSIFNNIEFVPDYTHKVINGETFLFVGGAVSIDRLYRKENIDYWKDEIFVLPEWYDKLPECDVLITHSSPINSFPVGGLSKIVSWLKNDPTLKEDLIHERTQIQKLFDQVKPKQHYFGHFHEANNEIIGRCLSTCLNIDQIKEIKL